MADSRYGYDGDDAVELVRAASRVLHSFADSLDRRAALVGRGDGSASQQMAHILDEYAVGSAAAGQKLAQAVLAAARADAASRSTDTPKET